MLYKIIIMLFEIILIEKYNKNDLVYFNFICKI